MIENGYSSFDLMPGQRSDIDTVAQQC